MRSICLSLLALLAIGDTAAATCSFTGYPFQFGMNTTFRGTCDAKGTMISFVTGATIIESLQLVEPPRHGRAGVRGLSTAGYLPQKDYRGQDSFVIRICGQGTSSKGCSNVTYELTAQ